MRIHHGSQCHHFEIGNFLVRFREFTVSLILFSDIVSKNTHTDNFCGIDNGAESVTKIHGPDCLFESKYFSSENAPVIIFPGLCVREWKKLLSIQIRDVELKHLGCELCKCTVKSA